jgi:hypothetical protein
MTTMTRAAAFLTIAAGVVIGTSLLAQPGQAPPAGRAQAAAPAPAPDPTPMTPPPATKVENGYTSLFNGKDLTGWKVGGPASDFKVVDGAIQANGVDGPGHLFYEGNFQNHTLRNFDLRLDVMAKNRSNGGVYVLTEFQESGFPGKGFEIQVNNSHTDRIRTGSLYHVVDLSYIPAKDGEWFPMEIQVKGQTVTVWVKGSQVLQWTQPADWNGAYDTPGRKIAPGTIAFQAHDPNSFTYYSNIRVKALN